MTYLDINFLRAKIIRAAPFLNQQDAMLQLIDELKTYIEPGKAVCLFQYFHAFPVLFQ